jgi:hypothetical protein
MGWLLLACFLVGLVIVMMFTPEGRGCLGTLLGLAGILLMITVLGGAVIFGALYLISG